VKRSLAPPRSAAVVAPRGSRSPDRCGRETICRAAWKPRFGRGRLREPIVARSKRRAQDDAGEGAGANPSMHPARARIVPTMTSVDQARSVHSHLHAAVAISLPHTMFYRFRGRRLPVGRQRTRMPALGSPPETGCCVEEGMPGPPAVSPSAERPLPTRFAQPPRHAAATRDLAKCPVVNAFSGRLGARP
jgi:hypothetical protein